MTVSVSPATVTVFGANGLSAGPLMTEPSTALNSLPWQGQSMVPSATFDTVHCLCVHTALNALNSPAFGCVTTTFASLRTTPPPTGISAVFTEFAAAAVVSLPED